MKGLLLAAVTPPSFANIPPDEITAPLNVPVDAVVAPTIFTVLEKVAAPVTLTVPLKAPVFAVSIHLRVVVPRIIPLVLDAGTIPDVFAITLVPTVKAAELTLTETLAHPVIVVLPEETVFMPVRLVMVDPRVTDVEPIVILLLIHVGVPVPPEANTWPVVPAALKATAEELEYATAPAVAVRDAFVPPGKPCAPHGPQRAVPAPRQT